MSGVIFLFSKRSFRASSLRHMRGMWSQSIPACDLIFEMNVISAPLNCKLSMGCFENCPSPNSMYTASNLPLGVNAKDATLPITRPYSFLMGFPIERKRLELDILLFFPPYLRMLFSLLEKMG